MSSYLLVGMVDPNHNVHVGWDPALNSFFAHVIDISKDPHDPRLHALWIGRTPNEIQEEGVVVEALKPYLGEGVAEVLADFLKKDHYRDAYA